MSKAGAVLALDQGTTSSRAIVFGAGLDHPRARASASLPSTIPPSGWVEHDPGGHLAHDRRDGAARRIAAAGRPRRRHRRRRHHQPARDLRALGPAHRQADPPRHRLAGPAHGRHVPRAEGVPATSRSSRPRPACCSIPISRPPRSPGCSTMWRARGRWPTPATSPSARSTAFCSGASPAAGCTPPTPPTPRARCSTTSAKGAFDDDLLRLFNVPRSMLPEVRDCNADFGTTEAVDPRRGAADPRRRRRSAGRHHRPGLLRARHGQGDLRHGLLCAAQYRRRAGRLQQPPADHHRLSARTASAPMRWRARSSLPARPCSGCATGSSIIASAPRAARWPASADAGAGCLSRAGLRRARRALLAAGRARRAVRPHARHRAPPRSRARRWRRSATRRAISWRPCTATGRARRSRCCASTAAWWRATGPCSSWPTSSMRRSSARVVQETTALGAAWLAGHKAGVWPDADGFGKLWKLERAFTPTIAAGRARAQVCRLAARPSRPSCKTASEQ